MNPSVSSPPASHPSLPACHLASSPVTPPSPLIVHLFFSIFAPAAISLCHFNPSFLPAPRESGTTEGFSSYYGLVYTHTIPSSTSDQVRVRVCVLTLWVIVWEEKKGEGVQVWLCAYSCFNLSINVFKACRNLRSQLLFSFWAFIIFDNCGVLHALPTNHLEIR